MDLNPRCTSLSISKAFLLHPNKKHPSAPHSETTGGSAADGTALATQTYRAFSSNVTNTHRRQLPRGWWVLYPPPPCPWPCPDSTLPHSHSNPFPRVPTPTPPPHCPYWIPSLNPCLFPERAAFPLFPLPPGPCRRETAVLLWQALGGRSGEGTLRGGGGGELRQGAAGECRAPTNFSPWVLRGWSQHLC